MDEIVKEPNEHTHVGDPVAVRRNVVLDTITQAASTSHETTRYIIGDALQPETNDILMRLPKKSTIERRIQRHRKKSEAPMANPRDRNFPIPERYADFILYDSGVADPQRIIAVGNRELISCFRNASIWFGIVWYLKCISNYTRCTPKLEIITHHVCTFCYRTKPRKRIDVCSN